MDDLKSDTAKLIQNFMVGVLIIVCVLAVLGAFFGVPYMIQKGNGDKVREMTAICVEKGYDGWEDTISHDRTERGEAPRGCFHNEED